MRSHRLTTAVGFVFLTACGAALAGPRIVEPDDPQGAEIHAVASEFLAKVADGDAAGAKALFAGPADQAELLEAHLDCARSFNRFRDALGSKWGNTAQILRTPAAWFRLRAREVSRRLLLRTNDSVCVAADLLFKAVFDSVY